MQLDTNADEVITVTQGSELDDISIPLDSIAIESLMAFSELLVIANEIVNKMINKGVSGNLTDSYHKAFNHINDVSYQLYNAISLTYVNAIADKLSTGTIKFSPAEPTEHTVPVSTKAEPVDEMDMLKFNDEI